MITFRILKNLLGEETFRSTGRRLLKGVFLLYAKTLGPICILWAVLSYYGVAGVNVNGGEVTGLNGTILTLGGSLILYLVLSVTTYYNIIYYRDEYFPDMEETRLFSRKKEGPILSEKQVLWFLNAIETGVITLEPRQSPSDIGSGNITYRASNGWDLTVFNDAGTWDYVYNIKLESGEVITSDEMNDMQKLREYAPPLKVVQEVYQIPQLKKR